MQKNGSIRFVQIYYYPRKSVASAFSTFNGFSLKSSLMLLIAHYKITFRT